MAVTFTSLTTGSDTTNQTGPYSTASVTPTANQPVLVAAFVNVGTQPTPPVTVSGCNLTWTQLDTTPTTVAHTMTLWLGIGSSPTTGAISIAGNGTTTMTSMLWQVTQCAGVDTTTANGVVQHFNASPATTNSVSAAFSGNVVSTNGTFGAVGITVQETPTAGSGWTLAGSTNQTGPVTGIIGEYASAPQQNVTATWTTAAPSMICGVELKALASAPLRDVFKVGDGNATLVSSVTGTVPATVQAGDVLAVTCFMNSSAKTMSISGGGTGISWTTRSGLDNNGSVLNTYVWTATAVSDSASSTVTVALNTGTSRMVGAGFAAYGVTESGVLVAVNLVTTAGTSMAFPSVTIPDNSGWFLFGLSELRDNATATAPTLTAPAGTALDIAAVTAFGTAPGNSAQALHVPTSVASGSQTVGTGTASTSVTANLYTIGLAPFVPVTDQLNLLINRARYRAATI